MDEVKDEKEQRKESLIESFQPKTVTELEAERSERMAQHSHAIPAQWRRFLESSNVSMRDLPNYDPETDTLLPPGGAHKNVFNPETGLIENPDWLVKTRVFLADFIEGLAFGRDIFDIDDVVEKPDWQESLLGTVGGFVSATSLLVASSLLVGLLWPGIAANPTSSLGKLVLKGTNVALKEGLRLGTYHKAKSLINPEATSEKTKIDTTMYAVSASVGRVIADTLLAKYAPMSPLVVDRLVTSATGAFFGQLGNFYNYDSPEEFLDDYLSVNTLVYVMADLVAFELMSRKEGTPEHVAREFERFNKQVIEYNRNPSEANQERLIRQMVDLYEYILDTSPETMERTNALYGEKLSNQFKAVLQFAKEHGDWISRALDAPSPHIGIVDDPKSLQPYTKEESKQNVQDAVRSTIDGLKAVGTQYDSIDDLLSEAGVTPSAQPVTPPTPEKPQPTTERPKDEVDEIIEKVATEGVPEEEALRLKTGTPREGTALINTSKMVTSPESRYIAEVLAGVKSTFESKTYGSIKGRAETTVRNLTVKTLDDLIREGEESLKHLQGVSELWTTIRMLNASAKDQFLEKVREGTLGELSPEEQGKLLVLKDLYSELAKLHKDLGSTLGQGLSSGNIFVGGQQADLFNLLSSGDVDQDIFVDRYEQELLKYGGDKEAVTHSLELFGQVAGYGVEGIEGTPPEPKRPTINNVGEAIVEFYRNMLVSPLTSKAFVTASQGIGIVWDITSHSVASFYNAIGKRLVGPQNWGSHEISFEEAGARAMGYLEGAMMSFSQPIATMAELMDWENNPKAVEGFMDKFLLAIRDPKTFEEYFDKTSLTPNRGYFGNDHKAITAEKLLGDMMDKPVLEVIGTMIDYFGAATRLIGFGSMEAVSRPMEMGAYIAELNSQLMRLDGITPEKFNTLKQNVLLYNRGLLAQNSTLEVLEKELGGPLTFSDRELAKEEFWKHWADGMFDSMDEAELLQIKRLDKLASNHGESIVWKQPFKNRTAEQAADFLSKWGFQLFVPFVKQSMKSTGRMLGRIGFRRDFINDLLGKTLAPDGQVDRARQMKTLSDFTLSIMAIWGAYALYNRGRLAPRAVTPSGKRSQQEAGMIEYGLRIGKDKWFPSNRLGPEFALMNMAVNIPRAVDRLIKDDNMDEATSLELIGAILQDTALVFTSGSAMIGARNALDLFTGRTNPSTWAKTFAQGLNPLRPITTTLERYSFFGLNPLYKEYKTESFLSNLPVLDTMGRPVPGHKNILGLQYTKQSDSPIDREILATRAYLSPVPKSLNGVKLSDDEYYALLRVLDEEIKAEEALNRLVESNAYKRLSTEQQKKAIRKQWDTLVERAQRRFLTNMDKYVERYVEAYRESIDAKYREIDREDWVDTATGGHTEGTQGTIGGGGAQRRKSQADSPWE